MKKVLSLVLVIAMVLSSFSFAFAANFEDVEGDYEDAINTLVALGVVTGYEDGTFRPERVVTRAEMAKLIVEILGYGDLVAGSKSNFADTQGHWADPWIALAAGRGLVIGTGDGNFTPDRTVSYDEAITMVVRALGYSDDCNELKNMTWPTNFKVKAAELGLTKNVALNATGADRGGVAQLLYNALTATLVTVNSDGDVVFSGKELLSRLAELNEDYKVTSEKIDPSNKNYAGDLVDLGPYIFQSLKVYLNDDDEVVYIKDSNSLVVEGAVDEVTANEAGTTVTVAVETADGSIKKVSFTVDGDGVKAKLPSDVSIFENRASRDEATFEYLEETESIKIVANEREDSKNGKIDEDEVDGFVLETQTYVIRVEEEYVDGDLTLDGLALPTNSKGEVDFTKIIVKGDADSLEDIEEDDVVVEYLAEDEAFTTLVVSRDTVEGTVTRLGGTDVYVDGVKYKRSETEGAALAPELNDEGVFFLDHNGKIVDFDAEGSSATDYAIIVGAEPGTTTYKFGQRSVDDYVQLKLVTQEGDEIIYDVHVKINSSGVVTASAKVGVDNLFEGTLGDDFGVTELKNLLGIDDFDDDEIVPEDNIIKYSLNKDGRISKITKVEAQEIEDVDTTKSSFRIVDNALVYDRDAQEAVSINKLSSKIDGWAVFNKNGQIEVLVTEDTDGVKYTFAYITSAQPASRDGDEVLATVAWVNGKKVDPLYTDADVEIDNTKSVYALDIVNDVIEEAIEVTTSGAITGVEVYTGQIADRGTDTIKIGSKWYTLSDDATVIGVDVDDDGNFGDVNAVRRLSAIRIDRTEVTVYIYEGYVSFVVIHE